LKLTALRSKILQSLNWGQDPPYLYKMEPNSYFSHEALARMTAAQGEKLEKVVCHLWQNIINKESPVEIIDNVQFYFPGEKVLTISCNEAGDALDAVQFDYKSTSEALQKEFDGKIRLFAVNASGTKMWNDVIGLTLESVQVVKEGEYHKAGSVLLVFGNEQRIISISPLDGLVIDYFEE
jgi:hypothetical protein